MKNGKEVVFTKDYAGKKKGDAGSYDGMLASRLVTLKVAKYKSASKKTGKQV